MSSPLISAYKANLNSCLRFLVGAHILSREASLWWLIRSRSSGLKRGLGFEKSLPEFNFAWLDPVIEIFDNRVGELPSSPKLLFGEDSLHRLYSKSGLVTCGFLSSLSSFDRILELLSQPALRERRFDTLVKGIWASVFQQYRDEIWLLLYPYLRKENSIEKEVFMTKTWTFALFEEILSTSPHLMTKKGRSKYTSPLLLFKFLFDTEPPIPVSERIYWGNKSFRGLVLRTKELFTSEELPWEHFLALGRDIFWSNHQCIPYPNFQELSAFKRGLDDGTKSFIALRQKQDGEWEWDRHGGYNYAVIEGLEGLLEAALEE